MPDLKPLPVYPRKPQGQDLEMLKEAKSFLNVKFLIQPVDAVPGSPGRVLSLRESPNFLCDHALVREPNVKSIMSALEYCLGLNDDPRGMTVLKMLKETFGEETTEIV